MRKAIIAALSVTAFATSMFAQTKPNFSGTWKLNVAKSDFGPLPAPDSRTDVITHNEPTIKIDVDSKGGQGDFAGTINYTTDGKECVNHMGEGNEIKTKLTWDGDDLVGDSAGSYEGNDFTAKDRWTLSDGGKTMTVTRHISAGGSDFDLKFVFAKQ